MFSFQLILIMTASIVSIVPFLGPYLAACLANLAGELNPDLHTPITPSWVRAELKGSKQNNDKTI